MIRDNAEFKKLQKELDEILDVRIPSRINEIIGINSEEIEVCDNFIKAVDDTDTKRELESLKASLLETNASFEALMEEVNRK